MEEDGYKVKAYYREIPCYFNPLNNQIWGRNDFYEILLQIAIWIDINIVLVDEFPVWIEKDEKEDDNGKDC